jgi:hypothetical protein
MMTMKRHDTLPDLTITCTDSAAVVNLTTATSIKIIATQANEPLFSRAVTGSASGVIVMQWQPLDTAVTGTILMEVEVTWPAGGGVQTFPASGYLRVQVVEDLG